MTDPISANIFTTPFQVPQFTPPSLPDADDIEKAIFGESTAISKAFSMPSDPLSGLIPTQPPSFQDAFPLPEEGKPKKEDPLPERFHHEDGKPMSADEIIKSSPAASQLGDQKEIHNAKEMYKDRIGDWENEPDPELRAKSAAKFVQIVEHCDNLGSKNGNDRGDQAGDGNISGVTNDGDVRHGTEAAAFLDGGKYGIKHLEGQNGQLTQTDDKYVREDGTTRSNAGQFFVDVGQRISYVLPGLGNVIKGAADGADKGGIDGLFQGATSGVLNTWNATANCDVKGLFGGYDPGAL